MNLNKLLISTILGAQVFAAGPFGLEINKSNLDEVRKKINCTSKGNYVLKDGIYPNNGALLSFPNCSLLPNMSSLDLVFDDDGVLVAAYLQFNGKQNYDDLLVSLNQKYKRTYFEEPFVGDKLSVYELKDQTITLSAPHMSFETFLDYESNDFIARSEKAEQQRTQKRQSSTASQL